MNETTYFSFSLPKIGVHCQSNEELNIVEQETWRRLGMIIDYFNGSLKRHQHIGSE